MWCVMSDRLAGLKTLGSFVVSAGILAGAGLFALRGSWPWRPEPLEATTVADLLFTETVDTLRRGETLSQLFARQGLPEFRLSPLARAGLFDPRRLRPGLVFTFVRQGDDSLPSRVVVRTSPEERVALLLAGDGWHAVPQPILWRAEPVVVEGQIESSLYVSLDALEGTTPLGADDRIRLAWDLADIFAWQVDFSRDIRRGDSYRVLAERLTSEEGDSRYGRVLAAELVIGGQPYSAFRFTAPDGSAGYYDAEGRSLRRAFLLAPVAFRRISSRINRARLHPILGIVRRHEGIDYAADPGTPVMAAGEGTVVRSQWTGGYGNLVEIRHANGITTRYGHLQGFARGIRAGVRVRQGDVVGYVGSTGLATGPHLHYEFRVNGVSRDPRAADLGTGEPVPLARLRDFNAERTRYLALLAGTAEPVFAGPASAGSSPVRGAAN
jgi:murein DD-endopeptidase MepM/ murein hydrolase activator NlpD